MQVRPVPRLIGLSENGLLANRILLDLRSRLAAATDPYQQSVIRLNMAVAMARVEDWAGALEELQRVKLPEQTGVGNGTVQYLVGLAAESLGDRAAAETAFKAAAASNSQLTETGPAVKELAEGKLAQLQRAPREHRSAGALRRRPKIAEREDGDVVLLGLPAGKLVHTANDRFDNLPNR